MRSSDCISKQQSHSLMDELHSWPAAATPSFSARMCQASSSTSMSSSMVPTSSNSRWILNSGTSLQSSAVSSIACMQSMTRWSLRKILGPAIDLRLTQLVRCLEISGETMSVKSTPDTSSRLNQTDFPSGLHTLKINIICISLKSILHGKFPQIYIYPIY